MGLRSLAAVWLPSPFHYNTSLQFLKIYKSLFNEFPLETSLKSLAQIEQRDKIEFTASAC